MASPHVFDIDELSRPISVDLPSGQDPRADFSPNTIYNQIKDARNAARRAERHAETGESDLDLPNWQRVEELGLELLREHAKDLQVVAWLLEALVRRHGFAGLRDGLRLGQTLVTTFWEDLYPSEAEDGVLDKVAPLIGLNGEGVDGTLIVPLRLTPLTCQNNDDDSFSIYHYELAMGLAALTDADDREQRKADGICTFDQLLAAGAASGAEFYRDLFDDVQAAQLGLQELANQVEERCGEDMMPSSTIQNLLEDCLGAARQIAGPLLAVLEPPADSDEQIVTMDTTLADGALANGGFSTTDVSNRAIRTREEAFRSLQVIAEYFRQAEPHSPVSYALEQVVRWGRMELPELMEELIADDGSRRHVFSLTGIKNDSA